LVEDCASSLSLGREAFGNEPEASLTLIRAMFTLINSILTRIHADATLIYAIATPD